MVKLKFDFLPGKTLKVLLAISFGLSFISFSAFWVERILTRRMGEENETLENFFDILSVGQDTSIPTWYSSIILLIAALLLLAIGLIRSQEQHKYAKHWLILSTILAFMSLDEVATIHEWSGMLIHVPEAKGLLHYSWVVFGMAFVGIAALYFYRFLRHLPPRTRTLFIVSALIFVGGAIGVEMYNARIIYTGYRPLAYRTFTTLEELCEMVGVNLLIYALLLYLKDLLGSGSVQLGIGSVAAAKHLPIGDSVTR